MLSKSGLLTFNDGLVVNLHHITSVGIMRGVKNYPNYIITLMEGTEYEIHDSLKEWKGEIIRSMSRSKFIEYWEQALNSK